MWAIRGPRGGRSCIRTWAPASGRRSESKTWKRAGQARMRTETMANTVAVTDSNFEQEVEKADGLTVVDFWAAWCGPCRMIAPILDQLAQEYSGKVRVA
ncbi:MAG TPA: thioredoxin domain-containing protein, partial [Gemmatimonadaceae bacterium]|nr:thioredoxin domain-containing protein [Gemmatimonadaceae bacterium]